MPFIPIDPEKIAAIVISEKLDSSAPVADPDDETRAIAGHLTDLLKHEVKQGRLTETLQPLQAGIGNIANAVMHGLIDTPFHNLKMYSEVLQDSTFDLFDAGKLDFASGSSFTLSKDRYHQVMADFARYKKFVRLRRAREG